MSLLEPKMVKHKKKRNTIECYDLSIFFQLNEENANLERQLVFLNELDKEYQLQLNDLQEKLKKIKVFQPFLCSCSNVRNIMRSRPNINKNEIKNEKGTTLNTRKEQKHDDMLRFI